MARAAVAISVAALCLSARAQTPGFWFVPVDSTQDTVNSKALSRDGSTLVGWVHYREGVPTYQGEDGFRWTRGTGLQAVPDGGPTIVTDFQGVSADGAIVAGNRFDQTVLNSNRPFRQVGNGPREIIPLPNGFTYGEARGISDDGNVVVGNWSRDFLGSTMRQPFVWTPSGGMVLITSPSSQAQALTISRDGATVVGVANQAGWFWRADVGFQVLSPPPIPNISWGAGAVNTSGSIIAGTYTPGTGGGTIRWVDGVPQDLGHAPGYSPLDAVAVSDSGSVIAGNANLTPMVWSEGSGFSLVSDYFVSNGVQLPPGLTLYQLTAMTPDGLTFAGYGTLDGVAGAYVVTVPGPGIPGAVLIGMAFVSRRRQRAV
jgi:uncharacterized membrane protein